LSGLAHTESAGRVGSTRLYRLAACSGEAVFTQNWYFDKHFDIPKSLYLKDLQHTKKINQNT
jgi:hypothetical protein